MQIKNLKFPVCRQAGKIKKSGFTLIELLIVIALLGSLAVGLLATVDPFEQLKKGRDTSTRNTVSELYNSFIRFYSINSRFPWATTDIVAQDMWTGRDYISEIITAGELKTKFVELATSGRLVKIFVTSTDPVGAVNKESVAVCFSPESKSFRKDDNTMFDSSGIVMADTSACEGKGGSDTCYWCVQ